MFDVTIVVPCYNMAAYVTEALDSVAKQTFSSWECIIINDGSTDDTSTVVQKWCKGKTRFRYIEQQNQGLSAARNTGIVEASSELILPLDSDDTLHPEFLEKTVARIRQDARTRIVFTGVQLFGARDDRWEFHEFDLKEFLFRNLIPCTALFYREDWERVGGYRSNMRGGFEDWDFWMSIVKMGGGVSLVREHLFNYRQRPGSMAAQITPELAMKLKGTLATNHAEFYCQQLGDPLTLTLKIKELERQKQLLSNSIAIRLGNALVWPLRVLMKVKR